MAESERHWLQSNTELVIFCPEVSAGLPIPRAPAEIITGEGMNVLEGCASVLGNDGVDVTRSFIIGAENALAVCKKQRIEYAVLAEGSPSCGHSKIYDGAFRGRQKKGAGVTAALLKREGVQVFSQHNVDALRRILESKR